MLRVRRTGTSPSGSVVPADSLTWQRAFRDVGLEVIAFEERRGTWQFVIVHRERVLQIDIDGGGSLPTVYCRCKTQVPVHHVTTLVPLVRAGGARAWLETLRRTLDGLVILCPR